MFFKKTTKKILSFVMAATMVAGVGAMNFGAISANAATSSVSATTTPKVTIINNTTFTRHFVRLGEETKLAIPELTVSRAYSESYTVVQEESSNNDSSSQNETGNKDNSGQNEFIGSEEPSTENNSNQNESHNYSEGYSWNISDCVSRFVLPGNYKPSKILQDARHKKQFEFIKLVYDKTQKKYYLDFKAKAITPESKPALVQIQYLTADKKQQLVVHYYIDVVKKIYKVNNASATTCSMEKGTRMAIKSANNNIITIKKVVSKNKNVVTYQKVNGQYVLKALKIGTAKVVITYNNTTYPNRPFTKELTIKVTKPIIG